jgi:predicted dehydrogenase
MKASLPPIVVIGAGGIVRDAHLPAYRKASFKVAAIYDLVPERAERLSAEFGIPVVLRSVQDATARFPQGAIFDVAIPPSEFISTLKELPAGAAALLQKPMGETLQGAAAIRDLCHAQRFSAAVNFQLRFAPAVAKARQLIAEGAIGNLHDIEVRITVYTPWHLWKFLESVPRVEIVHHSVHHIDLIRSFLGDPQRVYARTLKHPLTPRLASTRSTIILDYGDAIRATITTNHGHNFGLENQESYIKWEGTRGAIKAQLGLLMNYPTGQPDVFALTKLGADGACKWETLPVEGSWFPDAFAASMRSLMDFVGGVSGELPTSVDDAYRTMAVVEAAYESNDHGGTKVRY